MVEEVLKVNLVSKAEMIKRNKFLAYGLMDNPFLHWQPINKREIMLKQLNHGVDLKTAQAMIKSLYKPEASEIIISDLIKGKDTFIIWFDNGKGGVKSANSKVITSVQDTG